MGICLSCFSNKKENPANQPLMRPLDSTKIINTRLSNPLTTFPDVNSDPFDEEMDPSNDQDVELEAAISTPDLI